MFPYISTNVLLQLKFRDFVYKDCAEILDKYEFDNTYADIFDKAVIDKNNWQMYGSTKNRESKAYKVTKILEIYNDKYKEVSLNNYNNFELINLLSIRNKEDQALIKYERNSELEEEQNKYDMLMEKKKKYSSKSKKNRKNRADKDTIKLITGYIDDNGEYKPGYIDCLSIERARNYETWIEVGWALHNIDNSTKKRGSDNCFLLDKWIEWSKKVPEYRDAHDDEYIDAWNSMRNGGLGIGSLKIWEKDDDKDKLPTYNNECQVEGCKFIANCDLIDGKGKFCGVHQKEHMIFVRKIFLQTKFKIIY